MSKPLPPLNALKCFESAGRLGSIASAATELSITHGAVSRQVRHLEDWLGLALFRRYPRRIELTEAGSRYLSRISESLEDIALATESEREAQGQGPLRITVSTTFAMRWLMVRLPDFMQRHPQVELRPDTSGRPAESMAGEFDVAIRRAEMRVPGFEDRPFLSETGLPVISPTLLAENRLGGIDDLSNHTLLHSESLPWLWPKWFDLSGSNLVPMAEMRLPNLIFSIQAAIDGLGVAIGPSARVAHEIATGRLVTPLDSPKLDIGTFRVLTPFRKSRTEPALLFQSWLTEVAAEDRDLWTRPKTPA